MTSNADKWIPLFPEEEVPFILGAVLRCGARLRKLHAAEWENALSDRLRDKLDRDPVLRDRPIELSREIPIFDRRRARQNQLGRTDLEFKYSTGVRKPWPYFAIEAKRLHVTVPSGRQSLIPEYVTGHQGMMCFIVGRYAKGLASGGMLGYVFDRKVEKARSSIGASIEANHKQLRCCAVPRFGPSSVLKGDSRVSESAHSRPQGVFTIYHLLLAV
jgi:hypothetical protein